VDFVVVGFGLGALSVLFGVVMLGWAAGQADRAAARASGPDQALREYATAAGRRDVGRACLYAGAAVLLATVGALAGSLDDRTGAYFVTTTVTVAALGILVWNFLHRARSSTPQRPRPETRTRSVPLAASVEFPSFAEAASWESDPAIDFTGDVEDAFPAGAEREGQVTAEAEETAVFAPEPTAEETGAAPWNGDAPASAADVAAENDRAGDHRILERAAIRGATGATMDGGESLAPEDEEKLS
jgi:hypothetical protein